MTQLALAGEGREEGKKGGEGRRRVNERPVLSWWSCRNVRVCVSAAVCEARVWGTTGGWGGEGGGEL